MGSDATLRNTDNTARDHLANERTFLAWIRTALALVGFGLIFEKLLVEGRSVTTLLIAEGSIVAGAVTMVYATLRYRHIEQALRHGEFIVANRSPLIIGWAGAVLSIALAIAIWATP